MEGSIAIGDDGRVAVPEGALTLDLTGHSVIPGLVGMHDHMYYPSPQGSLAMYPEHATSFPRLYLAGGVTTIRTTGSVEPYTDLELKHLIDAGQIVGPKMNVTGPYLEGEGSFTPQMHTLKDAEDARRMTEFWMDQGVTSFKAYMHITPEELGAAIKAAHARGIKVTGHLCSIGFREARSRSASTISSTAWWWTRSFLPASSQASARTATRSARWRRSLRWPVQQVTGNDPSACRTGTSP